MRLLHSRIMSKETIKPSSPTPPHLKTYNLSLLDRSSPSIYMPSLFLYPNHAFSNILTSHQQRLETSQSLKNSLSQTLSQYYPFSGRFSDEHKVSVDCNDEGVEFVEAQIYTTLSEFIHVQSFENQPLDQLFPANEGSIHLLMVKLCYFTCGGLALAAYMSHKIADACTFVNFVNHWAAVTRKNSGIDQHVVPLSPHFISSPNDVPYIPEFKEDRRNNLVTKKFVFPNSKLAQLKAKAMDHAAAAGEEYLTRSEVLSALLYGCAVRAEKKKANSQSIDSFALAQLVNIRDRMINPLPDTAVGNLFVSFDIQTLTENELSVSHLTTRMKKAKMQLIGLTTSVANQLLRQIVDEASTSKKIVETFLFSCICKLPLYQVNFGWGNPVRVSVTDGYLAKNLIVLMDTPNGDGIEVVLALEEENMVAFQNDEQLLAYVEGYNSASKL